MDQAKSFSDFKKYVLGVGAVCTPSAAGGGFVAPMGMSKYHDVAWIYGLFIVLSVLSSISSVMLLAFEFEIRPGPRYYFMGSLMGFSVFSLVSAIILAVVAPEFAAEGEKDYTLAILLGWIFFSFICLIGVILWNYRTTSDQPQHDTGDITDTTLQHIRNKVANIRSKVTDLRKQGVNGEVDMRNIISGVNSNLNNLKENKLRVWKGKRSGSKAEGNNGVVEKLEMVPV